MLNRTLSIINKINNTRHHEPQTYRFSHAKSLFRVEKEVILVWFKNFLQTQIRNKHKRGTTTLDKNALPTTLFFSPLIWIVFLCSSFFLFKKVSFPTKFFNINIMCYLKKKKKSNWGMKINLFKLHFHSLIFLLN